MNIRTTLLASVAVAFVAGPVSALADTADKRIALANNYAGNSWLQVMLTSWDKVTSEVVASGIVSAADPFNTAKNQETEQEAPERKSVGDEKRVYGHVDHGGVRIKKKKK